MQTRTPLAALALALAAVMGVTTGCAVKREQSTVGQYVDDATITTSVKARFIEDKTVGASSIQVETLNGTVQLSGFAKSSDEKAQAEAIARRVSGVKAVRNDIIVRP